MSKNLVPIEQIVHQVQPDFEAFARIHGVVNFKEEASFALQILADSDYLFKTAMSNPDSLKRAVINVAQIGLSLHPYKKEAYLIPRKGKICLDISYIGYINLAASAGVIKSAIAEHVHEGDVFTYKGPYASPVHSFDPFGARGRLTGGYVITKMADDSVLVTHMSLDKIHELRDRSESWKSGGFSPWKTDYEAMVKKTLLRNARKSWPSPHRGPAMERFVQATQVLEEADPILIPTPEADNAQRADLLLKIREGLMILGKTEEYSITYLRRVNRRDLKSLDELTTDEMKKFLVVVNQMVDKHNASEEGKK